MEKFFVLKTVTDQVLADRSCAALEDAEIPVMLEHIVLSEGESSVSGYRLLVPSEHTQTALQILENTEVAYYDRRITQNSGEHLMH